MSEERFLQLCADKLEEMILAGGPEIIAAFIGEPVLRTGNIVPPQQGYWEKIQALLQKCDTLLISDEVTTGFGRLGTLFGSDHDGMKPNLITMAKGLTSAYAPLSGVIVSQKVWRVLEQGSDTYGSIGHRWTYSSHPACAAAGVAKLEIVNELDLVANAGEVGAYFKRAMADAVGDNCFLGEVRGEGLMAAIEFVRVQDDWVFFDASEKVGPRITAALLDKGVIGRAMPQGDILGLAPPLCPTREEADTIVAATKDTVEAVTATL